MASDIFLFFVVTRSECRVLLVDSEIRQVLVHLVLVLSSRLLILLSGEPYKTIVVQIYS
jgi:hypothetical protein